MKLGKIVGKRLIHKIVQLPPLTFEKQRGFGFTIESRKGIACGLVPGVFFQVKEFDGEEADVTCKKCRSL